MCDNNACIYSINNGHYKNKTKHNEIHFQIVKEQVKDFNLKIQYISSDNNQADILTKQVSKQKLNELGQLVEFGGDIGL